MGAIANFKKRRAAERAQQANVKTAQQQVSETKAPENEALTLLAALLGCDVDQAIEQAKELVEKGAYIAGLTEEQLDEVQHQIGVDLASDEDKSVEVTLNQTATDLEQSAATVEGAAEAVTGAAEQVESAAASVEDTANQLAYTAEDIGNATAELKEATAELKKPSEEQESSPGKTADKPKSSSKKSG